MPVIAGNGTRAWRLRDRRRRLAIWAGWLAGTLVFVQSLRFISGNTLWEFAADAHTQAWDLLTRMVPPRWSYMEKLWAPLWDTLNMATLGTLLGTLIAFPIAFLAARNTTPSRALVRPAALLVIVSSRSINSLIWALLLVTVVGPGVLAGIIAIALRSIGFVGKLLYEAIEEIDPMQVEAIVATGASRPQQFTYGILPQILPAFAGITVYRWDINIPRGHRAGAGRRRRHRAAIERVRIHAGVASGDRYFHRDLRHGRRVGVAVRESPPRHHLKTQSRRHRR
jgi:phosphonate transport system permease protein